MTRSRSGLGTLPRTTLVGALAVLLALCAPRAQAYKWYDDGNGNGCVQCHTGFQGGNGPLHQAHRFQLGPGGGQITNCSLCHDNVEGGTTPVLTYWSGPEGGFGCAGCHGRDYGETSPNSGLPKASGYGLRQHHANHMIGSCQGCHGTVAILPENVAPPYYGTASTGLTDPCSSAEEDMTFDMDSVGLDNDGDGLVDWPNDPDCPMPTTTTTTLPPGSGDVGITGKKLVIVDKLSAASKAKIAYVAKDSPADKGTSNDATMIDATLEYQSSTLGASGSASMPQGSSWVVNKATVAKYVNKDAPSGGAVKVGVIKPSKLLKVVMKDLGDSGSKIDIYTGTGGPGDPDPDSVDVATQLTVHDGALIRRHCGEFTGCARKIIAGGSGAKIVCKTAVAGASVTCPGSPSGAFLD